jgi:predicted alpha/beta hydrolase family esterase
MIPILIVPGLGGSGETHWQTHLQRVLPGTIRVEQDDWDRPDLARWLARLARAVESWPGAVLVAHSLGCPLIAHLAHRRPDLDIAAALLVAPADVSSARHTPRQTHGFAPIPLRPLPFRSIVVASTNDSYIAIDRTRELADAWDAEFVDAGPVGHINVASGFGPWPAGVRMVESLRARAGERPAASRPRLRAAARAR